MGLGKFFIFIGMFLVGAIVSGLVALIVAKFLKIMIKMFDEPKDVDKQ